MAVSGGPDVEFEHFATERGRLGEGGDGVFGVCAGCAAVGADDDLIWHDFLSFYITIAYFLYR